MRPPGQVDWMKQIVRSQRKVSLENSFKDVFASLFRMKNDTALITEAFATPFIVRATMAKQAGTTEAQEVLVFFRFSESGRLVECSRCYATDWGFYFNHLGTEGQRIGMYCRAVDSWVSQNALRNEFD
jgi:hypothetical protein